MGVYEQLFDDDENMRMNCEDSWKRGVEEGMEKGMEEGMEKGMKKGMEEGLMPLTYFEVLFLMGILLFSESRPDYCILETGMGGRLDATVLCEPVMCIITSISIDHREILGDTLEEIARQKALEERRKQEEEKKATAPSRPAGRRYGWTASAAASRPSLLRKSVIVPARSACYSTLQ